MSPRGWAALWLLHSHHGDTAANHALSRLEGPRNINLLCHLWVCLIKTVGFLSGKGGTVYPLHRKILSVQDWDMRGHIRPRLCFSLSIHSLRKECLHLMKWGKWPTISGALCQLRQRGLSRKQGHRKRCREHREHPGSTVWHPPQNSCKCWSLTAA